MDRRSFCVGSLVALGAAAAAGPAGAQEPAPKVPGLPGWHVEGGKADVWSVDGRTIRCAGGGGGYLTTDRQYDDFEISLEYRLPPGGNSGIGIRYPPGGHPAHDGIEVQLLDDDAPIHRDLKPGQYNGSLYMLVPPKVRAAKPPGEWNRIVIRCEGPRIRSRLNDVEIQDANAEEHTTPVEPERLPLSKRPRKGCIGLQSYALPLEFRNLEIKEL